MPIIEQVRFKELIQDPIYRAWLKKLPSESHHTALRQVWRISHITEPNSRWWSFYFNTYEEAYKYLVKNYRNWYDCALGCTHREFRPPSVRVGYKIVKVKKIAPRTGEVTIERQKVPIRQLLTNIHRELMIPNSDHHWCGYCRRPTVFGYFRKHHAVPNCVAYERRCRICGVRLKFLGRWSM